MKKIMLFFMFLAFVNTSHAAIDVFYKCHDENCLEGTLIDYSVVLFNNLNYTIWVDNVYLKDVEANNIIDFDVRDAVTIEPEQFFAFNFTREVKAPQRGYTFYFIPCMEVKKQEYPGQFLIEEVCDRNVESMTVMPLGKIECESDSACQTNEYCNDYKCVELNCVEGQIAASHGCLTHSCNFLQTINNQNCVYSKQKLSFSFFAIGIVLLLIYRFKRK